MKAEMVHWPGDPKIKIKKILAMSHGYPADVSLFSMGSHTGTHMDAPAHFISKGQTIDQMPLDATVGPVRVIKIQDKVSIKFEELKSHRIRPGERILFKTVNSPRCWKTDSFIKDFVYISPPAAEFLGKCRIKCVGVDYLSVGGYEKDGAKTHQLLLKAGIWIIEGLDLSAVSPGRHEMICLPLKFKNGDGAPARAILKKGK